MIGINNLIQELVNLAEKTNDFYEVEVSVLIRRDGGLKSDFFRAQSQWSPESEKKEDSAPKNTAQWL
jgi:hypothetical protein